jgi:hypothetical protein
MRLAAARVAAIGFNGNMRAFLAVFCLGLNLSVSAADVSVEQQVQSVFTELKTLKFMQPGRDYTVSVAGTVESGPKERFLRRRTAREISDSGLTSGCGDYACVFIARIEPLGFRALLVDAVEMSSQSLQDHFSGHSVVAIQATAAAAGSQWWLVDPTDLKVLSTDWSPAEKSFASSGGVYWIGYCGPFAGYAVHDPDSLRAFYTTTLAAVPRAFLARHLCRLRLTVDPTLVGKDGEFLNTRLVDFLGMQDRILSAHRVEPEREVSILLARGGDDARTDLQFTETAGWVAHVGLRSICSLSLLSYFERVVRNHGDQKSG